MSSATDTEMMSRALILAREGWYSTAPNPRVGAVIVRDGKIVGEGYHHSPGRPHAEVNALEAAGEQARGATVYVTLEPCCHFGRTPPCDQALIQAGVARVVVAMTDPNPAVSGQGVQNLRSAGIDVVTGIAEAEARVLNRGYISVMERGRPFVRLKMAMSLDGRTAMASGESKWITGTEARIDAQGLRADSSAIVTGIDTILYDDALLTVRENELGPAAKKWHQSARQPLRVVLDTTLRTPATARVVMRDGGSLVVCSEEADYKRQAELEKAGARVVRLPMQNGRIALEPLLRMLAAEHCLEVLVEAGSTLAGSIIRQGVCDEMVVYVAPLLMGSDAKPLFSLPLERMADGRPLEITDVRAVGSDWRITARIIDKVTVAIPKNACQEGTEGVHRDH